MVNTAREPRAYELMTILVPELADEDLSTEIQRIGSHITTATGAIKETLTDSPWGRRRLAYSVRHNSQDYRDGYYIVFHFDLEPSMMTEIERELRLDVNVMRYLLVHDDPKAGEKDTSRPVSADESAEATAPEAARSAAPVPVVSPAAASPVSDAIAATPASAAAETPAVPVEPPADEFGEPPVASIEEVPVATTPADTIDPPTEELGEPPVAPIDGEPASPGVMSPAAVPLAEVTPQAEEATEPGTAADAAEIPALATDAADGSTPDEGNAAFGTVTDGTNDDATREG